MKLPLTARLYIGFAVALVLTLGIGISSYRTFQRQATDADWVKHTYRVINRLEMVEKLTIDMETGRRGYRATREVSFLDPYYAAAPRIQPIVQELEGLLDDNPVQARELVALEASIAQLRSFWSNLDNDPTARFSLEGNAAVTRQERKMVDVLRARSRAMTDRERVLLAEREKASDEALGASIWQIAIGTLLTLLVVSALIAVIVREFRTRQAAEEKLRTNLDKVRELNRAAEARNWMLQGMSAVNDRLRGNERVQTVAQAALEAYTAYLKLPAGAFYAAHEDGGLERCASYGIAGSGAAFFLPGEGLPGAVARSLQPQVHAGVPADYWQLQSAAGNTAPGAVGLWPVLYNGALKGVLELDAFNEISDQQIELVQATTDGLAIAIHAAESRERVQRLLEQVQAQTEELQSQQEELRQTNEELTRQAEALQASEEELRVQEEELRQINAELEERNEAVETARLAVVEKARELEVTGKYKSEFLANMSHELRTPLNSVLILAKLLTENTAGNLTAKQVEYAGVIHKSGSDLLHLINDILDLSKIEAGKVDFLFEDVPVVDVARDLEQLFVPIADDKGLEFKTTVDATAAARLRTDKSRLEQVLKNLLSNAFKFTSKGGTITLNVGMPKAGQQVGAGDCLAFAVQDTGIGIPADKHRLVFEAFKQADGSTSRKFGGTGLGLSISRELARKLGGEIWLESEAGAGSTFTLVLPVGGPEGAPVEVPTPSAQAVVAALALENVPEQQVIADDRAQLAAGGRSMLIIEDDPHFAAIVRDFARQKGYKTIVAVQGDEGLLYARRYQPSAIILDMQLPVIDGWTLLKVLKGDPALQKIPVHIISAVDENRLSVGGALASVRKPLEKDDLEGAFDLIGKHLQEQVKRVLVVSSGTLKEETVRRLVGERHPDLQVSYVTTTAEALDMLESGGYQCIIADLGRDAGSRMADLQQLHDSPKRLPVIAYVGSSVSGSEELQLKKWADVIIQESLQSKERLMDELELFLYKMQESGKNPEAPAVPLADTTALAGRKVLVVDDDMRNVFALSSLLEGQKVEVLTASDGREGLDMLNQHPDVEMVLMDIMMPEMDGYEATRRLRADPRFAKLPVIALTAKAMTGDREKTLEAGASDYITKPVDGARLFSLMRVWLA